MMRLYLRKGIQERDARIKDLQKTVFETWAARDRFRPSASNDTGPTNAQRAEAAATITDLPGKLAAALATYQNLLQVKEAALAQANKECGDLELQQRITVEAMTAVIDKAHSTLDRVKGEKRLTSVEKFELFDTALNEIADKGREFLHRASRILQSEPEGSQTYKELIPSFTPTTKAGLGDDRLNDVRAPTTATNLNNKLIFGLKPTMPPVPQPEAPKAAPKMVSPLLESKGTTGPMAQWPPKQETKPSLPPAYLKSFPALIQNSDAGERLGVAPKGPVHLAMPDTGRASLKRMSLEELRQDTKRRVATGTLLPLSEEELVTLPSISGAVLRDREARKQAKAASTVETHARSGVSSERETREIQDTKEDLKPTASSPRKQAPSSSNVSADKDVQWSRDTTSKHR